MATVKEIIERLSAMDEDAVIAVPRICTKEDAEEIYEYATTNSITLTDEQWTEIATNYQDGEFFDDEALVNAIDEVI